MNTLFVALPFILLMPFLKQTIPMRLRALLASCSISIFFLLPGGLYFFSPIFLLCLANTIHLNTFNAPLPLKSLKMIRHFPSLKDSIDSQIPLFYLPIFLLGSLLYPLMLSPPSVYCLFTLPLLFFCPKKLLPYPFYLISTLFSKKKNIEEAMLPCSENEIIYKTNKKFPLEKYCSGFFGKKTFDLPISKKPHVVFLYLESFRSKEIGKCTPQFDQLKKQGIYFSNFFANASQTFKAMFATLYGLPPCFGPDFLESSSVTSLPVRGLPNFFKEHGYKNIFIKGGSLHFEKQGDFLKNHHFDELFDEKDIKEELENAYGTSWGVHDEFLYTFLAGKISSSKQPLFISAASITNHHPFILPHSFSAKYGTTSFEKTLEYTDYALKQAIDQLSSLKEPMHVYIMGDHGYPDGHSERPGLSPSLEKAVTHVPLLLLPLHCGKVVPQEIDTISSQIDILPTLLDLYDFKGLHSSIGSSLYRKRKKAHALLLNEAITKISGTVTNKGYKTIDGYLPLYETLYKLYKEKKISSSKGNIKTLSFENISIPPKDLQAILNDNPALETLDLSNSPLIFSLDLNFPKNLKKIKLDNNILIQDNDILSLPKSLTHISLVGVENISDKALLYLAKMPITEISLSCKNFSEPAMTTFFHKVSLKKLWLFDSNLFTGAFLTALYSHHLEEVTMQKSTPCTDEFIEKIATPSLKVFMNDNCIKITDHSLKCLINTSIEVLHLEKGKNITDKGIQYISPMKLHTFYMSNSEHITEKGASKLKTPFMQNLFCIDCLHLPQRYEDTPGKQVYFLKNTFS